MSLIITVWTNEGIVMGSDSRISYSSFITPNENTYVETGHYFDTQEKTFLCPNGCGISTCGVATLNKKNITGYIKHYINKMLNRDTSVYDTANNLKSYIESIDPLAEVRFIVAGYKRTDEFNDKQEIYHLVTGKNGYLDEITHNGCGVKWDGEIEVLTRLIKSCYISDDGVKLDDLTLNINNEIINVGESYILSANNTLQLKENFILWDLMTLQDAIDFVRYAINTTIETMRFSNVNKTVGGPIDILVIKNDESKWIAHKKLE